MLRAHHRRETPRLIFTSLSCLAGHRFWLSASGALFCHDLREWRPICPSTHVLFPFVYATVVVLCFALSYILIVVSGEYVLPRAGCRRRAGEGPSSGDGAPAPGPARPKGSGPGHRQSAPSEDTTEPPFFLARYHAQGTCDGWGYSDGRVRGGRTRRNTAVSEPYFNTRYRARAHMACGASVAERCSVYLRVGRGFYGRRTIVSQCCIGVGSTCLRQAALEW